MLNDVNLPLCNAILNSNEKKNYYKRRQLKSIFGKLFIKNNQWPRKRLRLVLGYMEGFLKKKEHSLRLNEMPYKNIWCHHFYEICFCFF